MTSYAVARLEEDGPPKWETGSSASTTSRDPDSDEELYLVVRGRAMFELDGDRVYAQDDSDFDPIRDERSRR